MAKPSKIQVALDFVAVAANTLILLGVFITSGLAGSPNATKFGFKNTTGNISDQFYTQVTPAGYTFSIWGVIYTWQALWIVYAWTFTCRPNTPRTIFIGVYIGYGIVNALNITWIYVWGNAFVVPACVILFLFNVVFYPTIGMLFGYFKMVQADVGKVDTVLTHSLPMNGLCLYATWTTIASLINLTAAAQATTSISQTDMATISLTLLLLVLLLYFALENTVLDNFGFRYVYSVYPVVIWALTGVLVAHWNKEGERRNNIYTLVLLVFTVVLFAVRLGLVLLFCKFRSHKKPKKVDAETEATALQSSQKQ